MYYITVVERVGRVLVPLKDLLEQLPLGKIKFWIFKDVELNFGYVYGLSSKEFESRSLGSVGGLRVPAENLTDLFTADFQMINGVLEGYDEAEGTRQVVRIECIDASAWDIYTNSESIFNAIKKGPYRCLDSSNR